MSWAVQTAAFKILNNNAGLLALATGGVHKSASQGVSHPHVEFGADTDISIPSDCMELSKCIVELRVWSLIEEGDGPRGPKEAQDICKAIQTALHKTDIMPDGHNVTRLKWMQTTIDNDGDGGKAWLGVVQFECLAQEILD